MKPIGEYFKNEIDEVSRKINAMEDSTSNYYPGVKQSHVFQSEDLHKVPELEEIVNAPVEESTANYYPGSKVHIDTQLPPVYETAEEDYMVKPKPLPLVNEKPTQDNLGTTVEPIKYWEYVATDIKVK